MGLVFAGGSRCVDEAAPRHPRSALRDYFAVYSDGDCLGHGCHYSVILGDGTGPGSIAFVIRSSAAPSGPEARPSVSRQSAFRISSMSAPVLYGKRKCNRRVASIGIGRAVGFVIVQ